LCSFGLEHKMNISLLITIATLMARSSGVDSLGLNPHAQSAGATPKSSEWNATTSELEANGASQVETAEGDYHDKEGIESTTETADGGSGNVKNGEESASVEHTPGSEEEEERVGGAYWGEEDDAAGAAGDALNAKSDQPVLETWWLWRACAPVVSVMGVFGNAMVFVLMQRMLRRNMQALGVLFTALALLDTLSLGLLLVFFQIISGSRNGVESTGISNCVIQMSFMLLVTSVNISQSWLLVSINLLRAWVVVWPNTARNWTRRKARVAVAVIVSVAFLVNTHFLFGPVVFLTEQSGGGDHTGQFGQQAGDTTFTSFLKTTQSPLSPNAVSDKPDVSVPSNLSSLQGDNDVSNLSSLQGDNDVSNLSSLSGRHRGRYLGPDNDQRLFTG
jgi:hypothetical protein